MPSTDRALRSLAQSEPLPFVTVARHFGEQDLGTDDTVTPENVADPHHFDMPPNLDSDLVVRVGNDHVLHVECQGYHDETLIERMFRYHLYLVLRYPDKHIHSVLFWLYEPPEWARPGTIERDNVKVRICNVLLPRLPAEELLQYSETVCFAVGADRGTMSDEELCTRVVQRLREIKATKVQWRAAMTISRVARRNEIMKAVMEREQPKTEGERVIWEEWAFPEWEGATRECLLKVLEVRGIPLTPEQRARIDKAWLQPLQVWFERALTASSAEEVLAGNLDAVRWR